MAGQVVSPSKGWNWRLYPRDAQPLRRARGCVDVAASLTWQLLRGLPMSPKREDWWLEMQMLPGPDRVKMFSRMVEDKKVAWFFLSNCFEKEEHYYNGILQKIVKAIRGTDR